MKKLSAVIIDDEKLAREIIKNYLRVFNNIQLAAECENGFEGIKKVNELNPDIVFLDIQMPKINGFEMLELIENQPAVIFTTAYDQYAIKAFEKNAVDYLLKPFSAERFNQSVKKALANINDYIPDKMKSLSDEKTYEEHLNRIVVKNKNSIIIFPVEDIIYFESQDDYVYIHTAKGKYLKQKTMKYYENNLDTKNFIRIHRSYIINIDYLSKIELLGKENYIAKMKNGEQLNISRSGYAKLKEALS